MPYTPQNQPPPTPLAERLDRIMKEMDWSQSELARAAGTTRQNVNSWLSGRNENMQDAMPAVRLQARTKFNVSWILTGEGPTYIQSVTPRQIKILETVDSAQQEQKIALRLIFPGLEV